VLTVGRTLLILLVPTLAMTPLTTDADATQTAAKAQRAAAASLVAATPAAQRNELLQPFTDVARSNWHYTPRKRVGVAFDSMDDSQRAAAQRLLAAALSDRGLEKVRAVIALEIALRELESSSIRNPGNYAFAIYGTPHEHAPWGWRIEGHHLSLHFTLDGDRVVSTLPQFIGANPADVPRNIPGGPRKGQRALKDEEDRAFALLASLSPAQRESAVIAERPYGDILTRNAAKVDPMSPAGVRFSDLSRAQQAQLLRVIDVFATLVEPTLAEQRLTRVRAGSFDAICFAWAGAQTGGQPYYYRIQGPQFLIELDNTGGNHIHSVWRDFDGDWGRDVLGEHYRNAVGTEHKH
jgi:hypothetical protein